MDLIFKGIHAKIFKEHHELINSLIIDGLRPKDISKLLEEDYGIILPFQAIPFYRELNEEYLENLKKDKLRQDMEDFIECKAIDYAKDNLKEFIRLVTEDLPSDIRSLEPEKRMKLFISAVNSLAKLEGLDKTEVNVNSPFISTDLFDDDLIEEFINETEPITA